MTLSTTILAPPIKKYFALMIFITILVVCRGERSLKNNIKCTVSVRIFSLMSALYFLKLFRRQRLKKVEKKVNAHSQSDFFYNVNAVFLDGRGERSLEKLKCRFKIIYYEFFHNNVSAVFQFFQL